MHSTAYPIRPSAPRGEISASDEELPRQEQNGSDKHLLGLLEQDGFSGKNWEKFTTDLAEYGYQVLSYWIDAGQIITRCQKLGLRGVPILPWRLSRSDAKAELVGETVALALVKFRELLRDGRWSSEKGASLTSYFTGQCLIQFASAYRRWLHESRPPPWSIVSLAALDQGTLLESHDPSADPADHVVAKDKLERWLHSSSDDDMRRMLLLKVAGYSHAEIGEVLGATAKGVETRLYRARRRFTEQDST
jgi:DNA-directed RNA polymerase specialized sigma24 family protein